MLLLPLIASAYDVEIDGIYYNLDSENQTAEVTCETTEAPSYSDAVIIPASITYSEQTYSVTGIGTQAFYDCAELTSITIPESITNIGTSAFLGCANLTEVHIADITAWCKIPFSNDSSNPLLYARHLYLNGEELTELKIPEGITQLSRNVFLNCLSLTSVEIPGAITSIGNQAFYGCNNLTSITVNWDRPLVINTSIFNGMNKSTCILYVPKGTAKMFMAAAVWNTFANIVEFEDGSEAHYINLHMGNGGILQQSVELGNIYLYKVKPDIGWSVSTVTFNGTDMTSRLKDGQFSTPVIIGDSELVFVFKQDASNAKSLHIDSGVKVYAGGGTIRIAGADNSDPVNIYNKSGILVASSFGNATFTLDGGIYIIKIAEETFKVNL